MKKSTARYFFAFFLLSGSFLRADDANASDNLNSRLRAALRQAAQQVQDAQDQLAAAQATRAQSDQDKTALQAKLDAANAQVAVVTKQEADDKTAASEAASDAAAKIHDLSDQLDKYKAAVDAWEKDDKANLQLATLKEGARAQLAAQSLILQRSLDERERENLALYKLGDEILTRYQNFSLGDALAAKEPFTGTSRAKLQALVQDYRDKLLDHVVTPDESASSLSGSLGSLPQTADAGRSVSTNPTTTANP